MRIADLATQSPQIREQAAALLVDGFHEPRGWTSMAAAREEVAKVLADGFARGMVTDHPALPGVRGHPAHTGDLLPPRGSELLVGWVGGLPQYNGRVWELHPMVVRNEYRRRGIGRALVAAFEAEAAGRGGVTAMLGTDDDSGMTSLSGANLYDNLPAHIAAACDLGRGHPFLFYRKLGFVITGVMPDANGTGRPDIYMCKPIGRGGVIAAPEPMA